MQSNLRSSKRSKFRANIPLFLLALPGLIYMICFNYLPMFGVIVAFKDYNYLDGIFNSQWVGFKYFKYFFASNDLAYIMRNTLLYNIVFMFLKQLLCVVVAIFLYEITHKYFLKVYQTAIILPNFISWVLVAYIGYALFSNETGLINSVLKSLGKEGISWYSEPKYWPGILTFFEMWKGVGMGCIIYYAALMGVDESLFEAASIDGANRVQQIIKISLPTILPTVCIMLILAVGGIMGGDFGLFFQVPRNSGALYPVTNVISTYTYYLFRDGNFSQSAAIGLFQNVVGLILTLGTNAIVKKVNPENAMY